MANKLKDLWDDLTNFAPPFLFLLGMIFGITAAVLGGIGFGLALIVFFIGVAYKLLTANIW